LDLIQLLEDGVVLGVMGDAESHAVLLPSFVTHGVTHNKKWATE